MQLSFVHEPLPPSAPDARRQAPQRGAARWRHGFTLIEVMISAFLLCIVGAAIVGFLSALSTGGTARQHISDPTIESTLALRRLQVLAPELRSVLAAADQSAILWTSDRIASRSVHLSEVALLRFDPDTEELLLESVTPEALFADRTLEQEFLIGQYDSILGVFDTLRLDGMLDREVLSEGADSIEFSAAVGTSGVANATFIGADSSARVRLAPETLEEPLR
jgi:prepilin-type N-terminal cleavage/methylation domain-containing protein